MSAIFPELPTKLGIYSLTRQVGEREYSELYLATQSYVDRAVVIEVLRPNSSAEMVNFFQETARRRAAAALPHVAPVLESAQTGHLHYLIQEQPKGKSLAELLETDGPLSIDQAFMLAKNVAELYCSCLEQGLAANPLTPDAIYLHENEFTFFSPAIHGRITEQQRAEQMASLADILESVLPEQEAGRSNISIIIHWLRNGYGNMPLEWQPLSSSLNTLSAQKYEPEKAKLFRREMFKASSMKRRVRRLVRSAKKDVAYTIELAVVGVVAAIGCAYWTGFVQRGDALPAVDENYVYVGEQEADRRVSMRMVSIEEYGDFLQAWERMSAAKKRELHAGMPPEVKDHQPLQWNDQNMAARLGGEWQGKALNLNSPVRGVTYWDALAYARYMKAYLPSLEQVELVRQHAGEPMAEEWTSSNIQANFPLDSAYMVYPAYGNAPVQELNPAQQATQRGFRIVTDNPKP